MWNNLAILLALDVPVISRQPLRLEQSPLWPLEVRSIGRKKGIQLCMAVVPSLALPDVSAEWSADHLSRGLHSWEFTTLPPKGGRCIPQPVNKLCNKDLSNRAEHFKGLITIYQANNLQFWKNPWIQIYTILSCFTTYQAINLSFKSPLIYLIIACTFFLSAEICCGMPNHSSTRRKMTLGRSIKPARATINTLSVRSVWCTIYML